MEIEGDADSFVKELELTGIFILKEKLEYYKIDNCANPVSYNDPWFVNNWVSNYALDLIEARCAWSLTLGNSSVIVGFADTEFKTHEDLVDQIVHIEGPITDEYPHGLYTTGCCSPETNNSIGIAGVGYNTKIAGYRVSHSITPTGVWGNPKSAILAAWDDGRPVINVSWGGTGLFVNEAQQIISDGIVLVLSGGNDTLSTNHSDIADIPGVIVVSSVNSNNEHGPTHHARNQWIDLCAPGSNVGTCEDPDSASLYRTVWGTSAAAPYVSCTIGLMLSVNPCLTPAEVENIIKNGCDPIADAYLFPGLLGAGRLNAYNAVLRAIEAGTTHYDNMNFTGTHTYSSGLYLSSANSTVKNGAHITFQAGKDITLDSNFTVELGGEFTTGSISVSCP